MQGTRYTCEKQNHFRKKKYISVHLGTHTLHIWIGSLERQYKIKCDRQKIEIKMRFYGNGNKKNLYVKQDRN